MTTLDAALSSFRGTVLRPGDDGYDSARRLWNAAIDRRPAFIARCTDAADVAAAVRFGTRHDLPIAVRGGGHSIPGHSVCDGGLMIDLSPMRAIRIDPDRRRAHAQPGCTLRDLDTATEAVGLATPGGEISHTGIAGLTLGGGVGWLSRMFGLACDNLVEAEVVTAGGEVVTTGLDTGDPELLWGLRGGGGNFGVVTRFCYRLHPIRPMLGGMVAFPLRRGREVLALFGRLCAVAPDQVSLTCACVTAPRAPFVPAHLQGQPIVALGLLYVGDPADGQPWAGRLRAARPDLDLLDVVPYTAVQSMVDDGAPPGLQDYVKSEWLAGLDDAVIDHIVGAAAAATSPLSQVLLRQLGGAISRVPADATAFSYRDAAMMLTVPAIWASPEEDPAPHVAWARTLWTELQPVSSGGGYVNQLDADEGPDRVRAAYAPRSWTRLVALKRRYDPDNVFHLNQNIPPSSG
jgi:FAD/FMN-containing dehydrogenase